MFFKYEKLYYFLDNKNFFNLYFLNITFIKILFLIKIFFSQTGKKHLIRCFYCKNFIIVTFGKNNTKKNT